MQNNTALFESFMPELKLLRKGKVRDVYDLGDSLLIVASDRISAFDFIMKEPVSGKGKLLSSISEFWFAKTKHIIANHFITSNLADYPQICQKYATQLEGRSMIVQKTNPLPIEFVIRGYLAGSAYKEYCLSQSICGIDLPDGLLESSKLPQAIFTPATKAEEGHDENISTLDYLEILSPIIGKLQAEKLIDISLQIYNFGAEYADQKGIILADTKFEFGQLPNGEIILIDEALTPDSSRYWLKSSYEVGKAQLNFDKQVLRDWLETQDWDKNSTPPDLSHDIIGKILSKYQQAKDLLLG